MAIALVAALIALLVLRTWPAPIESGRHFGWYHAWVGSLHFAEGGGRVAIAVLVPTLICALLAHFMQGWFFALVGLVFALAVLLYCLGPRDFDRDVDAVLEGADGAARATAATRLRSTPDGAPRSYNASELVEAAVFAALRRRFAVLFWFFLLGPTGALAYRLAWVTLEGDDEHIDPRSRQAARRFANALDWAPAHLMVWAMALVSNFDAVMGAWRGAHANNTGAAWEPNAEFLAAVAHAGVDADLDAGDGDEADLHDPRTDLADARRLLMRVLVVWLAVVALIVLAGWLA